MDLVNLIFKLINKTFNCNSKVYLNIYIYINEIDVRLSLFLKRICNDAILPYYILIYRMV